MRPADSSALRTHAADPEGETQRAGEAVMVHNAGMSNITLRGARDDDFRAITDFDGAVFGEPWKADDLDLLRPTLELDRFILAHDGDDLVGVSGNYSLELTVPGLDVLRVAGLTWVAVSPTFLHSLTMHVL